MAVVAVAGVVVFFAAHRGREIGAHMIDTDAPGYLPPPPAPGPVPEEPGIPAGDGTLEDSGVAKNAGTPAEARTPADAPSGGTHGPETS